MLYQALTQEETNHILQYTLQPQLCCQLHRINFARYAIVTDS